MTEVEIAVVGGGLAGFSAALQAARLGRSCAVFSGDAPGGALLSIEDIQGLPGHPDGIPGYELCPMLQEQVMDAGAECVSAAADAVSPQGEGWLVRSPERSVHARCVVLAPGSRLRSIGVPGEERLFGKGVSHCASCDAPMLRGRPVAVVGGGDAACQEALAVAAHASEVHLLLRGETLRAQKVWRDRVQAQPKIVLHPRTIVQAIDGEETVSSVRIRSADDDRPRSLAVDAVFVFAGLVPNTGFLGGVVPLDADGRIVVDPALHTPLRGLLGAGNARAGSCGQAAGAAADGIAAAWSAHRFLTEGRWPA